MRHCCADAAAAVLAANGGRWPQPAAAAAFAAAREAQLLEKAVQLRFVEPAERWLRESGGALADDEGDCAGLPANNQALPAGTLPTAPSLEEVGNALGGLPAERVAQLLKRASAAVPLVADPEPLAVIAEDEHLLACDKPPGLRATVTKCCFVRFWGNGWPC